MEAGLTYGTEPNIYSDIRSEDIFTLKNDIQNEMSREKLLNIYELYKQWAGEFCFACRKGCATCCTQSVSLSTLEGTLIVDYIRSEKVDLLDILTRLPPSSFNPPTTNQFADACLQQEGKVEEITAWDMNPCVFLQNGCCSIYPVRSFMCRSFGSRISCHLTGEAEVDPLYLTLNTVILQCIEHLDQGKPWGNLNTILSLMTLSDETTTSQPDRKYRLSRSIPGFLIPPEEIDAIQPMVRKLLKILHLEA